MKEQPPAHGTEWILTIVSTALILVVIVYAWKKFSKYENVGQEETGLGRILENKWYVDEIYNTVIVKPVNGLGSFFNTVIEKSGIDKAVNGVGRLVQYSSRQFRYLQSGLVGNYILLMVLAVVLFIWAAFYLQF